MPVTYIKIVCFANSRKLSGRCIAGKIYIDGKPGDWIRPVSNRPTEEISEHERQYEDGSDPRVLDIIDVPFLKQRPKTYQRENRLIDAHSYWRKGGTLPRDRVGAFTDSPQTLWTNGESTHNGRNDAVTLDVAGTLRSSLFLIDVPDLGLHVFSPGAAFGNNKRRVQARFRYSGDNYYLWVTDPTYERDYLAKPNGTYKLGAAYLTVSLGEPYEGRCYKLVAAIVERN